MHTLTKCTYTSDKWNLPALKIPHVSTQECLETASFYYISSPKE